MKVLYTQRDGSKIVLDKQNGEEITAHIVRPDGTEFPPKQLDALLARGYWEVAE